MEKRVTDETTEGLEESGSLEDDIKAMRAKNRAQATELNELKELLGPALEAQRRELLRDKGFDPDTVQGRRLVKAMVDGEIAADGSDLVEVAEQGFGYEPSQRRPEMTDAEFVAAYNSNRLADLQSVTFSDMPPGVEKDIADAEAVGNWDLARALKSGKLAQAATER